MTMRPRKKRTMLMELKREIIAKHEQGVRVTDLARMYDRSTSMICAVLKRKELIKNLPPSKGIKIMSKLRTSLHANMEKQLMAWMVEKQQQGGSLTQDVICEKARAIYDELVQQNPHTSPSEVLEYSFKGSRGWFANFKNRIGIRPVAREPANSDGKAPEFYIPPLSELIESKKVNPHQAWLDFTTRQLTPAWKKLWLEAKTETTFEGLEPEVIVIEERISPRKPANLEVNASCVKVELVEEQSQKLKTEQIHDLHELQQMVVERIISFKKEQGTM